MPPPAVQPVRVAEFDVTNPATGETWKVTNCVRDGRGRWMDNIFIERLWRSLKHEDVYLKGYADGLELHEGLADWIAFYNDRRPHQALGHRAPMAVWRSGIAARAVDMMDNARALPTCPQPQQQQQQTAFLAA
jgi:putative transposase